MADAEGTSACEKRLNSRVSAVVAAAFSQLFDQDGRCGGGDDDDESSECLLSSIHQHGELSFWPAVEQPLSDDEQLAKHSPQHAPQP
ncbi:hypothetical protein Q1695_006911 [Nippostrongylus brasiliensis]|nr:hypothetical protein Q1695_006911 [Nippostrongylus brasiliensis]